MLKRKHIFLACVILLLISCISAISATDSNTNSTTKNDIITEDTTHAMENVKDNYDDNSYNSGLDTRNSVTTNIGEKNTSQNSETNTDTDTTNTDDSTKTIKKTTTTSVKTAQTIDNIGTWTQFKNAITSATQKDLILKIKKGATIKITDGNQFLYGSLTAKNITIIGNGATFDGQHLYRFLYIGGDKTNGKIFNITISNLTLANCGKEKDNSGQMALSNHGGVIYGYHAPILTINNCTFINSTAHNGGVICGYDATIIINDSLFINNKGRNGGIFKLEDSNTLIINNSQFINTTAKSNGGVLMISSGTLTVTNSLFEGGKISGEPYEGLSSSAQFAGSALHMCSHTEFLIENNTFKNNYAYGEGTVYMHNENIDSESDSGILRKNTFINNTSPIGGAIVIQESQEVIIENNTFTDNKAIGNEKLGHKSEGGAIYIGDESQVSLNNNIFNNNTATTGGAIYSKDNLKSSKDKFSKNNAENGGAIHMVSASLTITNGLFENNIADVGGAIWTNNKVDSSNTKYNANTATSGGAISLNTSTTSLTSTKDTYSENSASVGGAISNYHGTVSLTGATINGNTADTGGFAYNGNNANLDVMKSTINGNKADQGAFIYNAYGGTVNIASNTINNNNGKEGSLIYNKGTATITGNNVNGNKVTQTGAYVIYNEDGTITVTGNDFSDNTVNKEDILIESNNDLYTVYGNNYQNTKGNYLETTFSISDVNVHNDDKLEFPVNIYLRDIYNDKVRDGTLNIYFNGGTTPVGSFDVNDGVAKIKILNSQIIKDRQTNVRAVYSTETSNYQSSETTFKIIPFTDTRITIDLTGDKVVNRTVNYIITVEDIHGNKLSGIPVNVTVNGTTKTYPTGYDEDAGKITVPIVYDSNGDKTIRAQYLGNEFYNHNVSERTDYIRKINTQIDVKLPTGIAPEDNAQLNITLKDEYGNVIPNKRIIVKILDGSESVIREEVYVDENGYYEYNFKPVYAANYEVEITFEDQDDRVHNFSINKQNLIVEKITSECVLRNTTPTREEPHTGFEITLTGEGEPIPNAPLSVIVRIDSGPNNGKELTFTGAVTDEAGKFIFEFNRINSEVDFTVIVDYLGSNRYKPTDFAKPFNGANILFQNVSSTNTYINETNIIRIEVKDENGNPLDGWFYITCTASSDESEENLIAKVPVVNGIGVYEKFNSSEYHEAYKVFGSFQTYEIGEYIRVFESTTFKIDKRPTHFENFTILNETVYNTTIGISIVDTRNNSNVINGGEIRVRYNNSTDFIDVGKAEVVNNKVIITLNGVDRHQDYDLIIDYSGDDYFLGRETKEKVTPQKLPVTLTPSIINNLVGNVVLRVDVTSDYDSSVENGTVYLYLDESEEIIAQGHVRDGYTLLEVNSDYLNEIGTYPIEFVYTESETFKDTAVDYDLSVFGRPSDIVATVNNTVIHNVTVDVILTDQETGDVLVDSNITAYNSMGQVIGIGTTDKNGFVTIKLNLTQTGPHEVTFAYDGNKTYQNSNTTIPINVEYRNATIEDEILNNVTDNVTIKVHLFDTDNGSAITKGDIAILYKDGTPIAEIVLDNDNGIAIFQDLNLPSGENKLVVKLLNDGTYDDTEHDVTVNVEYRNLSVNFRQDNPYVTESTIIVALEDENTHDKVMGIVRVYDDKGVPIGEGKADMNGIFVNLPAGTHNITIVYPENGNYNTTSIKGEVTIIKHNTTLIVETNVTNATKGDVVNIKGTLKSNRIAQILIPNATILIYVDNIPVGIVKTDIDGNYEYNYTTTKTGELNVTVIFEENHIYLGSNNDTTFIVTPRTGNLTVKVPVNAKYGDTVNITGVVTDSNGNPLLGEKVNVTVNGKTYETTTDENGEYSVPVDNLVSGKNNVTASVTDEEIEIEPVNDTFKVSKGDVKLTVNPIKDAKVGNNISIIGKLVDKDGNPITDSTITIKVNDEPITVTTDNKGNYELVMPVNTVGINNVTVTFGNENYTTNTAKTDFTLTKYTAKVFVDHVIGIVGEDITLRARVYDENANPITGGNLVFKLNGRTLKIDGRFDTNNTNPMKFAVKNGIVTFTMKADLYLRAGKNITASYSGSYKYEAAKANIAEANIKKRNAELEVKVVPSPARQDSDTVFIVKLRDVTKNVTNNTCITENANIILKLNGKTLKNDNGTIVSVPVDSTTVTYAYHILREWLELIIMEL